MDFWKAKLKKLILILFLFICSCAKHAKEEAIEVNFSPNGGAAEAIVREISSASNNILIQAYSFTNPEIGQALFEAHKRGVQIEVILDRENLGNKSSLLFPLYERGVSIFIDSKHAIAHNKIIIIDNKIVITGSMNFTKAGNDSNAENSLIIKNNELCSRYIINWQTHRLHSEIFNE